ncbi:hypothetical protein G6F57_018256 [Rhizopus arrhizus]|nr:hypothetical protein G6F57_018256 [Rhizopus arrhizus]
MGTLPCYGQPRRTDGAGGRTLRTGPRPGAASRDGDWRNAWLSVQAPAVSRPFTSADGSVRGTVTVQADTRLARDTLWQGGVRILGLVLVAGVFWALFALNLVRWIEVRTSRDICERVRTLDPGNSTALTGSCELAGVDQALVDAQRRVAATVEEQNSKIESLQSEI